MLRWWFSRLNGRKRFTLSSLNISPSGWKSYSFLSHALSLHLRALLLHGRSLRSSVELLIQRRIRPVHRRTARQQQTEWVYHSSLLSDLPDPIHIVAFHVFSTLFFHLQCPTTPPLWCLFTSHFHLSPSRVFLFFVDEWWAAIWKRDLL